MPYDLKTMKAPRMAGRLLRAFAPVLEKPPLGETLAARLIADAGIAGMRDVPAEGALPFCPPLQAPEGGPTGAPDWHALAEQALAAAAAAKPAAGFRFETLADYASAYRAGDASPEQVAERMVAAIGETERRDPPMRIVVAQNPQDLMAQARASAERYRQGKPRGPLDGVPVLVKDELDVTGYTTRVGTSFIDAGPATADAEPVARLRAAGALIVGKAHMHEIGIGVTGYNASYGPARNPYDPARATGGSSSGPAAAVAAGLGPIAVGADGGGSIRIPAAFCGVVGLKPTFGRVSEHGAAPLCWSVAHVGPLAATASDAAAAYAVMAGRDPKDRNSLSQPPHHLTDLGRGDLSGIRLGVYTPWFEDADPEVVAACRKVVEGLVAAGCRVVEIEVPELDLTRVVHLTIIISEMAASHLRLYRDHRKDYGPETRLNLALARRLKATDYVHAQRLRMRLCENFDRLFEQVDAIVTPATGCTAPTIRSDVLTTGESDLPLTSKIMRYAPAPNVTGLPAISFPAGTDSAGLPIGIQAIGRAFEEHLLLRLALAAEGFVERRQPRVSFRLLQR